jgi:hypothetical protein
MSPPLISKAKLESPSFVPPQPYLHTLLGVLTTMTLSSKALQNRQAL